MTLAEMMRKINAFVTTYKRYPTLTELSDRGISRAKVRQEFGKMENLKNFIARNHSQILDLSRSKVNTTLKNKKRYIITTAVVNGRIHPDFYANLKLAEKTLGAQLIIGIAKNNRQADYTVDPRLRDEFFVTKDVKLNKNISLLGILNNARKVDPSTGLANVGQRSGTIVTFSPKQRLRYVATGPGKLPNALMTTGAITLSNYKENSFMPDLGAYKADIEHLMGGVIIEIENDKIYHFRQIQADKSGAFIDMGKMFKNGKVSEVKPAAIVLGDTHVGETNPIIEKVTFQMIKDLSPERIFLHDVFDGASINPHEKGKQILLAKKASRGDLSLDSELKLLTKAIKKFTDFGKKVYVVASNHNDFLNRYLEDSEYVKHPFNYLLCLELAQALFNSYDPVRYAVEKNGLNVDNLYWLGRNDSFKIAGIELAAHGDRGAHGSKGSPNTLEQAYINCVVGHAHTPQIMRGVYIVGTSTDLTPHYGPGYASAWMNTHCLVYPNGQRQMINIIQGKYRL